MIRVLLVDDQELVRSGFRTILESEPDIEVVGEAANGVEAVSLAAESAPDVICMDVEMPEMDGIEASRRIIAASAGAGAGAGSGVTALDTGEGASSKFVSSEMGPAVLILTTFGHEQYLFSALAAGVSGFLLKTSRAEQLIDAVHTLASGNALLGPDVTRAVIEQVAANRSTDRADAGRKSAGRDRSARGGTVTAASAERADDGAEASAAPSPVEAMKLAGLTERERQVLLLVAEGKSNGEIAAELFLGEATVKTHISNTLQKLHVRDRIQAIVWVHTSTTG